MHLKLQHGAQDDERNAHEKMFDRARQNEPWLIGKTDHIVFYTVSQQRNYFFSLY